jgi:PAS domain-containing protein
VGLRRRDGRVLECLYSAELVEAPEGKLVLASMSDASEPSRLRSELARANERLGNALSSACLGAWEWNIQTGECAFDERWAAIVGLWGRGAREAGPSILDRLTHPDDLAESGRRPSRTLFRGHPTATRSRSRAPEKSWLGSGSWTGEGLWARDRLGPPLLMAGTRADIRERHAFEDAR